MLEFLKLHCALTREFLGLALHFPAGLVLDMVLTEYGFAIFVNLNLEMGWAQILQIIIIIFFFQFWATWKKFSRGLISFEKSVTKMTQTCGGRNGRIDWLYLSFNPFSVIPKPKKRFRLTNRSFTRPAFTLYYIVVVSLQ